MFWVRLTRVATCIFASPLFLNWDSKMLIFNFNFKKSSQLENANAIQKFQTKKVVDPFMSLKSNPIKQMFFNWRKNMKQSMSKCMEMSWKWCQWHTRILSVTPEMLVMNLYNKTPHYVKTRIFVQELKFWELKLP